MKKVVRIPACGLLLQLILFGMPMLSLAAEANFEISTQLGSDQRQRLRVALQQAEQASEGKLKFSEIQAAGDARESYARVRAGKTQLALVPLSGVQPATDATSIFHTPFEFNSLKDVEQLQAGAQGNTFLSRMAREGVTGVTFVHGGLLQLVSMQKVDRPSGYTATPRFLAGQRVALGNDGAEQVARAFRSFGANVATGRPNNLEEAWRLGGPGFVETTWTELQNDAEQRKRAAPLTMLESNHRYRGYVIVSNSAFLAALEPATRSKLTAALALFATNENKRTAVDETRARLALTAAGNKLIRFNPYETTELPSTSPPPATPAPGSRPPVLLPPPPPAPPPAPPIQLPQRTPPQVALPVKRPPPPTAPPAAPEESLSANWNAWATDDDDKVTELLLGGRVYTITLDISPYVYRAITSAPATAPMKQELSAALKAGRKTLRLKVRATLIGDALSFYDKNTELELKINLESFRQAASESPGKVQAEVAAQLANPDKLPAVAAKLGAGHVDLMVRAASTGGCAQVAFTVWDESGMRPVDHIVYTVPVKVSAQERLPSAACKVARLQGGFGSLAGALSTTKAPQIDAVLNLYQFLTPKGSTTTAIYVDVAKYRSSPASAALADRGIYLWDLQSELGSYVANELPGRVAIARDKNSYADLAAELQLKVFPVAQADTSIGGARSALLSLGKLMSAQGRAPTLLFRAISAEGRQIYAPLAMLAAGSSGAKHVNVVTPLPRENYDSQRCIDNWTVAYPEKLDRATNDELEFKDAEELIPLRMTRLKTLPELRGYLDPAQAGQNAETKGEALLLLAHHGNGSFWFTGDGNADRVPIEQNNRLFKAGSAAFISACSVAAPQLTSQGMIERFNQHGLDAMVVSPFPVNATYGRMLALAATRVVRSAYQAGSTLTLTQIFEAAAADVAKELNSTTPWKLEFIVVGNHELSLCRKPGK